MKRTPKERLKQSLLEMKKMREGKKPKITWQGFQKELKEEDWKLPKNSIFDNFIIDNDEVAEKLIQEKPEEEKRKTPKIDIMKKIEEGKKVLESF